MMQLLIPLGLLGLLGILALILIYIIKPNYQTKHVSTTFVWKLSLKYKKKRLPTSKVRNIILFLCQVLVLTLMAGVLAKPAIVYSNETGEKDVIAIIDSSASMYASNGGDTRFQRALTLAQERLVDTVRGGGYASVIIASSEPSYLVQRQGLSKLGDLNDKMNALIDDEYACSYGTADIDAAMRLAEDVLSENASAEIYLYTDTEYLYVPDGVNVVPVNESGEWNAGVLSVNTELEDGYQAVYVEVACYGRDQQIQLHLDVEGANAENSNLGGEPIAVATPVFCNEDTVKTVVFYYASEENVHESSEDVIYVDLGPSDRFYSYQSLHIYIEEEDSFETDNNFYYYGGQREIVNVVYASSDPNPYFTSGLDQMKSLFSARWDLKVKEIQRGEDLPTQGYDLYIYEHVMPDALPGDGIVFLIDPDRAPAGAGFRLRQHADNGGKLLPLQMGDPHPVTEYLDPAYPIEVSAYTIVDFEPTYVPVLTLADGTPMLLIRNEGSDKIAVMPFSVHFSTIGMRPIEWITLLYNMFNYYLPSTVDSNAFEVGEQITVNDRGPTVYYSDMEDPLTEFPATLQFFTPGTYTLVQELYFGAETKDVRIFVKIPANESDVWAEEDALADPYREEIVGSTYDDLLIYLAAVLVALLFVEWWLQSRDGR